MSGLGAGAAQSVDRMAAVLGRMTPEAQHALVAEADRQRVKIWDQCRKDIWLWLRHYVTTTNLHVEDADSEGLSEDPFPDYPHIRLLFEACGVVKPRKVLVEKSRDMMFSWGMAALFLHDVMFFESAPMFMTTYLERYVDDGGEKNTINSLFGRIRHMYSRLPEWMMALAPLRFSKGKILNTKNGSFITGIKSTEHSGRAGKFRRALADEFAHFDQSEANLAALNNTCPRGLILGSTPGRTGKHNAFGRLANQKGHGGFKKLTLHYSMHPSPQRRQGTEWWDAVTSSLTPEDIARELEISYEGAIEARVWGRLDRDVHVQDLNYDPRLPLYLSFDHGLNEETVEFWQQAQLLDPDGIPYTQHRMIEEYQGGVPEFGHKMTVWENIARLKDILSRDPYNFEFEPPPKGARGQEWKIGKLKPGQIMGFYADPRGSDMNIAVQSRKTDDTRLTSSHAVYLQHGFRLQSKFSKIKDGVTIIEDWISQKPPCLVLATRCLRAAEAMINHRHVVRNNSGERYVTDSVKEDWTKHWADSARYYAIHVTSLSKTRRPAEQKYMRLYQCSGPVGARRTVYVPVTEEN